MSARPVPTVKVTIRAPVHQMAAAIRAFDHAYHNSDFSHGFAVIQSGGLTFCVKKNPAGYSVWGPGQ